MVSFVNLNIGFFRNAKQILPIAEKVCAITVAHAAPFTPMFNITTKSISSIAFSILAKIKKYSGVFASPKERITEPIQLYTATDIVPAQEIRIYPTAVSNTELGVFNIVSRNGVISTDTILNRSFNIIIFFCTKSLCN